MADWSDYEAVRDLAADLKNRVTALTDEIKALPPRGKQTSEQQQEAFDLRRLRTPLYERMAVLSTVRDYLYKKYEARAQEDKKHIREVTLDPLDVRCLEFLKALTEDRDALFSSAVDATPELAHLASTLGPDTDIDALLTRIEAEASAWRGGQSGSPR